MDLRQTGSYISILNSSPLSLRLQKLIPLENGTPGYLSKSFSPAAFVLKEIIPNWTVMSSTILICRALLTLLLLLGVVSNCRSAVSQLRPDLVRDLSTGGDWIELHTPYGPIPIRLLPGNAPRTVELIKRAVKDEAGRCKENCLFYRAEARPKARSLA
jgi:hypothetical protein